jgi:hypothetical protein
VGTPLFLSFVFSPERFVPHGLPRIPATTRRLSAGLQRRASAIVQNAERSLNTHSSVDGDGVAAAKAAPTPAAPPGGPVQAAAHAAAHAAAMAEPIGRWCDDHDERNSFVFTYILLSVVLSLVAGLFWLGVLVGVHFALEMYRNRSLPGRSRLAHATFGIKLDVTLVLMALALSLYADLLFAALGLRAVPRAGSAVGRLSGRLPSLRRIVRAALLVTDEVVRIAAYYAASRGIGSSNSRSPVWRPHSPWAERWSLGTHVVMALGTVALFLLIAAPWLTGNGVQGTLGILAHELSPFSR